MSSEINPLLKIRIEASEAIEKISHTPLGRFQFVKEMSNHPGFTHIVTLPESIDITTAVMRALRKLVTELDQDIVNTINNNGNKGF